MIISASLFSFNEEGFKINGKGVGPFQDQVPRCIAPPAPAISTALVVYLYPE